MNYKDRLSQSPEQKELKQLDHTVAKGQLQAQADLLETRSAISQLKEDLEKLKSSERYSLASIVSKQQEIDAMEAALALGEKIFAEDFPA